MLLRRRDWLRLLLPSLALLSVTAAAPAQTVEFNRDIRPILSDNCFACHGPDPGQRKAKLRLDTEEGATEDRGGYRALVPGKPQESELFRRITDAEEKQRMPPARFGKRLTPRQIDLVRRWIEQGGRWQKHWSLLTARRPALPEVKDRTAPDNPIDRFILARLEQEGLRPAPQADRRTLARRLAFDLTGLPPKPEEVDAFLADTSPLAYEKLVERLLASQHYGERMALYWLDLVRYADTGGYHSDNHRDVALYRDYVIAAFNANMPFDRFTLEQLAGDLLPNPTRDQRIASGYNRLLMTTEEGGAQAKEYLAKYAADRVRNVSSVWLGLTLGCAECHDHKFDPFTTKEFYTFASFFADIQEKAVGRQDQTKIPTPEQLAALRRVEEQTAAVQAVLDRQTPALDAAQATWEEQVRTALATATSDWEAIRPERVASAGGATLTVLDDRSVLASGANPAKDTYTIQLTTDRKQITGLRLEALTHPSLANQSLSRANGNFVLTQLDVEAASGRESAARQVKLSAAVADFSQPGFPVTALLERRPSSGWAVEGHVRAADHMAVFTFARPLPGGPGTTLTIRLKHESAYAQHTIGRFRLSLTSAARPSLSEKVGLPPDVIAALAVAPGQRTPAQREAVARHYRGIAPELEPARQQLAELKRQREDLEKTMPQTLVSMATMPRTMRVLPRGNWLDDSGEVVLPGTPAALPPALGSPGAKERKTRLDLARWMVAPENPLVARVFVNRLWKLFFGQGLVRTLDDFGSQGAWPTHPDLLDWLAVEFRESGWDVKHLVRQIVLSRTYRQTSQMSEELRQRDPYNQLLARQARFRLDAEMVRDNALAVSGLLAPRVGGDSVKPYQPAGYWAMLNFPKREWQHDHGDALYRRGLYTYWCRTFPHPGLVAFDAPSREECTVERPRSNTPLQALVLLNDPVYVEAARAFAERLLRASAPDADARIQLAYRQALCRSARPEEVKLLAGLYQRHLAQYRKEREDAAALLRVGERPVPADLDAAELAAWTSVARVLLNLHETITRN